MVSATSLISPLDPLKYYTFIVHMVMKHSIDDKLEEVLMIDNSSEWYKSICYYPKYGTFPKSYTKGNHDRLWKLDTRHTILVDVLYQKSFDRILLRCLKQSEIPIALE
jgi:hypothetical protein